MSKKTAAGEQQRDMLMRLGEGSYTDADLAALREMLKLHPEAVLELSDLCGEAIDEAVKAFAGKDNALFAEGIQHRRQSLRQEFGYDTAPMAEKLLIDEIILCWVSHYLAERKYRTVQDGYLAVGRGEAWEKRVTATQRRYLRAIETLARVRKLFTSITVQVNVANKQLNIAAGNLAGHSGEVLPAASKTA